MDAFGGCHSTSAWCEAGEIALEGFKEAFLRMEEMRFQKLLLDKLPHFRRFNADVVIALMLDHGGAHEVQQHQGILATGDATK